MAYYLIPEAGKRKVDVSSRSCSHTTWDSLSADSYTTAAVSAHRHKPSDLGPRHDLTSMSGLPMWRPFTRTFYTPKSIDTQANSHSEPANAHAPTYSSKIHRLSSALPSALTELTNSSVPTSSLFTHVTTEDERRRFQLAQAAVAQNKRVNLPQPVKTVVNDQGPMVSTESEEVPVNTVGGGSSHARNNSDLKPLSKSGGLKSSCPALFTDDTSRFLEAISPKPVNPVHVTFADHPYPPRLPAKSAPIVPKSSFIRLRPELRGQSSAVAPPPPPLVQASAGGNNIVTHSKETELLGRQYETHSTSECPHPAANRSCTTQLSPQQVRQKLQQTLPKVPGAKGRGTSDRDRGTLRF
ncbi:hypothetical protein JR316_0009630 [Psilocybe cubensis]|uniref:Uncharacterized protein n=1 Tax=Psilocybe cubensis TaxID=181762 RepID=A0ACB8GPW7_PSICU|nr:hypothetical protein JR316_0009630 [Psilocybe cubensis]KAH9477417.1 hypothetical protein JR316_0009630 [Psilocybe cubensis]